MSDKPEYVTFRDVYEATDRVEKQVDEVKSQVDKVKDEVSKVKIGLAVVLVAVLSPKIGGPDAASVVTAALQYIGG